MRILIVDNTLDFDSRGSPELQRYARLAPGATIQVRRAPELDLPSDPGPYDRIVLSGSRTSAMEDAPWIERLHEFIRRSLDLGKPFLGVCYGHQALVRALGGRESVRRAAEAEFGWTKIEVIGDSPLFKGMPRAFHSFSAHFEEVASLPTGLRRIARSEDCEIQACQLEGRAVFGIQFHPEKDLADAKKVLAERKKKGTPKKLLHLTRGERLYDSRIAERLFLNFFDLDRTASK